MSVKVKFYLRPDGRVREREIDNVYAEDACIINKHGLTVSMEEIEPDNYAVYLELPIIDPDTEDNLEIITLSQGRSCEDTIQEAVLEAMDYYDPRTKTWKV